MAGSGGEIPWRYSTHKYDVEDIALLSCAQPAWLHPRLRFFVGRENKLPVDQNSFMALIAPRGLMLTTAITEHASNPWGMEQAFNATKEVYRFLGAEQNLGIASRYGLHFVNSEDIEEYIDFFDYVFGRSENAPYNKLHFQYSFEWWRQFSGEKINPLDYKIKSPNDLLQDESKNQISTSKEWESKKTEIEKELKWLLGDEPAGAVNPGPMSLEDGGKGEDIFGSFLVRPKATSQMKVMKVTPYKGFGDYLYGYLYYPANERGKPINTNLPVVIYLHEYDYSKGFSAMGFDHEIQSFFEKLTQMGFAVFSFDMLGFGNRLREGAHFYQRYPHWSEMGKIVTDVKGAVTALSSLNFIDKSQIIVAGYSLGGTVGIISAALDKRIAGVVSVAGFTPLRTNTPEKRTEGIKAFSHLHGLFPRLGFFAGKENRIPVDFDEILSCIAPRPVFIVAPSLDKDANLPDIKNCVQQVGKIYRLYSAQERLSLLIPEDYNRFSAPIREEVYQWIEKQKTSPEL